MQKAKELSSKLSNYFGINLQPTTTYSVYVVAVDGGIVLIASPSAATYDQSKDCTLLIKMTLAKINS